MNNQGSIRPFHGRLDFAPFVGVLFLMLPLLLFHTSMVFKPGIEVDITLPESSQHTGVNDPSLAVAVDANGILHFRNRHVPSSELLWPQVEKAIVQGGLQPGEVSLLIQADKAVRHEVIIDLCTMAGKIGIGRVLLASRPPDFVRPFDPELKTEP